MSFLTVCLNPTLQKTLSFFSITPGVVNRTGTHRLDASGKGINVTRVLTQLGKKAVHLTQLGGDLRSLFLFLCEKDGLSVEWAESESQIRFCYTLLTGSDGSRINSGFDNSVTELIEEAEPVAAGTEQRLIEKFDALLNGRNFTCLIVSGTKAAGFSDNVIPSMVQRAKEKGLKIILDIKGNDLTESLQYSPDIIKPNLFEFAGTFMPELIKENKYEAESAMAQIKSTTLELCKKNGCRIILTNGSREIIAADGEAFFKLKINPVKAVNTIGCGDAFTAGLASAIEDGAGFREAIDEGCRCGTLNAALIKPGVINN
ncbi:MAG: PfkB family carbohydrate kinase [Treponema sp.]|jgi:fructose-1-phosphate kinase PfkB-like protein|nr:PfkB family carbohydrate kinase [Treponema sp.]